MLLAGVTIAPVLAGADLPRNALWTVVRSCVTMNDWLGTPFPCLNVQTGPKGFAILRAPGSRTHLIVTPTVRLSGLESPVVRSSTTPYWRAALDARALVAAGTGVPLGNVALSINSRRSRSQDQLHIHAECAPPQLLHRLRTRAALIGSGWTLLPEPIEDSTYWARRVAREAPGGTDALSNLSGLPNGMDPAQITFGAVNLSEDGAGDFIHLVSDGAVSSAEDLLDPSCAAHRTK